MKYKEINNSTGIKNPISIVLKNRNIKDVERYLNTNPEIDLVSSSKLKNIDIVKEILMHAIKEQQRIGLLVDCDIDGYTSGAMVYMWLREKGIIPQLFFHEGKQHGLSIDVFDSIKNANLELLIIPDAASEDYNEHKELSTINNIIILDHHEAKYESDYAIVVNTQLSPEYTNKQLSGAGVVYKVISAIAEETGEDISYLLDLCALGNIGDGMNLHNLDTRCLVHQGLKHIKNPLIKAIIKKQTYIPKDKITISTTGWQIAPMLNAVIRIGTQEEKKLLFQGFVGETDCEDVVNMCLRVQRRQNSTVKKLLPEMQRLISEQNLNQNKVIILNLPNPDNKNIMGLLANKLLNIYNRPIILVQPIGESLMGSSRSPRSINNFKDLCSSINEFDFCQGHQQAFGCGFNENQIENITVALNELLKETDLETTDSVHMIDMKISYKDLKKRDILEIGKLEALWGNGIEEPLFVITDLIISTKDIKLLGKNNVIRFIKDDITFIKMFTNKETWKSMTMCEDFEDTNKKVKLELLCKFKCNKWNGNVTPQVDIVDFNVESVQNIKINELPFF